jgi:hypothetical protein
MQKGSNKYTKKAKKVVGLTMTMVKIIFVLIIVYTAAVTIWISYNEGFDNFFKNIATISVGGFWAFFLGYFGWRMGQSIEMYFYNMRKK